MGSNCFLYKKVREVLGVSELTLRKWADEGLFPCIRTPKGTRLYQIEKFIKKNQSVKDTEKQKYVTVESLPTTIEYMSEKYPNHKIASDIGSGVNFKRLGLRTILDLTCKGQIDEVVVAYRDRLCRFAFELIE